MWHDGGAAGVRRLKGRFIGTASSLHTGKDAVEFCGSRWLISPENGCLERRSQRSREWSTLVRWQQTDLKYALEPHEGLLFAE